MLYYLFTVLKWCLLQLPTKSQEKFFKALAHLAYKIDKKHKRVIAQNLSAVYGSALEEAQITAISKGCYETLMQNVLQIIRNSSASHETMLSNVHFQNYSLIEELLATKTPIIFCSAHYDNWEKGVAALALSLPYPLGSVYKALNNSAFNDFLLSTRSRCNNELIERNGAFKKLAKKLKKGEAIGMLIDQNIDEKRGVEVDFFGISTLQTFAPAVLARKYNAYIVPAYIYTPANEKAQFHFDTPFCINKSDNEEDDIKQASQRIATSLEAHIKRDPSRWFWCHRRWKSNHPEFYEQP